MLDLLPILLSIALAILLLFKFESRSRGWALGMIALILGVSVFQYLDRRADRVAEQRERSHGELSPPSPGQLRQFSIGNAVFPLADPNGVVLRDGSRTLLRVEQDRGMLQVTAEFVGEGGEVLAYLERNEWKVNPNKGDVPEGVEVKR